MIFVMAITQIFKGFDKIHIFARRCQKPDTEIEIARFTSPERVDPTKLCVEFKYACAQRGIGDLEFFESIQASATYTSNFISSLF
jgi:hypothetical protein